MMITPELFESIDEYGARVYSGRGMFGARCLGVVGLENLLRVMRKVPTIPVNGWVSDGFGKETIYYNPRVQLTQETIDTFFED